MRKLIDIVEHNKGSFEETIDIDDKISSSTKIYAFAISRGLKTDMQEVYRYAYEGDENRLYFTMDHKSKEISAYILVSKLKSVWQVKGSFVNPDYRGVGLATDLYYFLVRNELGSLISDSQLTDAAEALWNALKRNLTVGIYDKELDKKYSFNEIGNETDDGSIILDPQEDETHSKGDFFGDMVRFFLLAETKQNMRVCNEGLEKHYPLQYFLKHGKPKNNEPYGPTMMPRVPNFGRFGEP